MSFARERHVFAFLGVVTFLTVIGNLGLVSVMPTIGRAVGMPDYLVASVFSLSAMTWAVSSPFWTRHTAGAGPNRYMRSGLVSFLFSMAGCGGAVAFGLAGLITLLVCILGFFELRAVFGLLGPASAIATQSLIAHATAGEQRTRVLTGMAGAQSLGTIVGPAIAPFAIVEPFGLTGPMVLFAALGALALAGIYLFLPRGVATARHSRPHDPSRKSILAVWSGRGSEPALSFGLLLSSAQASNLYTIGCVILDWVPGGPLAAQDRIELAMTAGAAMALAAKWDLPRIVRLVPMRMMLIVTALSLVGNLIELFDSSELAASAGFVVVCFGYGLARPPRLAARTRNGSRSPRRPRSSPGHRSWSYLWSPLPPARAGRGHRSHSPSACSYWGDSARIRANCLSRAINSLLPGALSLAVPGSILTA